MTPVSRCASARRAEGKTHLVGIRVLGLRRLPVPPANNLLRVGPARLEPSSGRTAAVAPTTESTTALQRLARLGVLLADDGEEVARELDGLFHLLRVGAAVHRLDDE